MKKNALFLFVLFVLTTSGLTIGNVGASDATRIEPTFEDNPMDEGDESNTGYNVGDPCGYVMGTGTAYPALPKPVAPATSMGVLGFTAVDNTDFQNDTSQACLDANGYFYNSAGRKSQAYYAVSTTGGAAAMTTRYTMDLAYFNTIAPAFAANIDRTTGNWTGYARFTDTSIPAGKRDVWFNWTCSSPACSASSASKYQVHTDLATGNIRGYAWSDYFGFINFNGLTSELPPRIVTMRFTVTASDGTLPNAVDLDNGPFADGSDFYRLKVEFFDESTGVMLKDTDITSLNMAPDATGNIFLNQVEDTGNAITVNTNNPTVFSGCGATDGTPCVVEETSSTATWHSWNAFVKSRAPSSDFVLINNEFLADRAGCTWIYGDQGGPQDCGGASYSKEDVFYNRVNDRNQYILNGVTVGVTFADSKTSVAIGGNVSEGTAANTYVYTFAEPEPLGFRPLFRTNDFSVTYDGTVHKEIGAFGQMGMHLVNDSVMISPSSVYQAEHPGAPALSYSVNYQMDVEGDTDRNDTVLLMDTAYDDPGTEPDCTRGTDTKSGPIYQTNYALGYGVRTFNCSEAINGSGLGTAPGLVTDYVPVSPTAEQWVCIDLELDSLSQVVEPSCYYTAYLPRVDRHVEAEPITILGTVDSIIGQDSSGLNNDDTLAILGNTDTFKFRNQAYSQVLRYAGGKMGSTSTTAQHLDEEMKNPSGGLLSLLAGSLLLADTDVIVDGSDSFLPTTVVVRGKNVIIAGNVTGGTLGIIAFRDEDGDMGNVYIAPWVTDLNLNVFADGAVLSYDGEVIPTHSGEFSWPSLDLRFASLKNQLYWKGSINARNTVNGYLTGEMGDGTVTSDTDLALEHDLNYLRQYRRCYPTDSHGVPDTSGDPEDCEEGAVLSSSEVAEGLAADGFYPSFILDYSPAEGLPIFSGATGLFQ